MKMISLFLWIISLNVWGGCPIEARQDLLAQILLNAKACPTTVQELKELLINDSLKELPAMVANRGFHNSNLGSFSIFESVTGKSQIMNKIIKPEHLYFGHFTALNESHEVILDQDNTDKKLLIEVISFDFQKGIYNFYELIGSPSGPKWFYRGNSFDAYYDNRNLKIKYPPQFGTRMRCSACHNSGGPIMKELSAPHNDWWRKDKGLPLGKNIPSKELETYLLAFIDASDFAKNVRAGQKLLEKRNIQNNLSSKEILRPLFCTTEINLKSDTESISSPQSVIQISSEIFVDPFLVSDTLTMNKSSYIKALQVLRFKFPETNFIDADHAFLAPVRSELNLSQVRSIVNSGIIDEEFALDILSVDFEHPLFSKVRCSLLDLVPISGPIISQFKVNLGKLQSVHAKKLSQNLEIENKEAHREKAKAYLNEKQKSWSAQKYVENELIMLNELRTSVFEDDISKNPRGQILEPGFRVIFPVRK
jgi:hypothetical protein